MNRRVFLRALASGLVATPFTAVAQQQSGNRLVERSRRLGGLAPGPAIRRETRRRLDGLENGPAEHWWHEVVLDVRTYEAAAPPESKRATNRTSKATATKKPRRR
jgi:hypothetical protein